MADLYQDQILDHYKNPRNVKKIENPNFTSGEQNPSCGDSIAIEGIIENGIIKEIYFTGKGCILSQAAASLITEYAVGKNIDEILKLDKEFVIKLMSIKLGPNRLHCALLPLQALQQGIIAYKKSTN